MIGSAPYALAPTPFPFPALAALAGRTTLGGPREVALACLVAARLASGVRAPSLPADERATRATGARSWLGALAVPAAVRTAVLKVAEATAGDSPEAVATALGKVMEVTAGQVDGGARLELQRLAASLTPG